MSLVVFELQMRYVFADLVGTSMEQSAWFAIAVGGCVEMTAVIVAKLCDSRE